MGWIRIGASLAFLGVAAGAFGAHALKDTLSPEAKGHYQTAAFYHLVHSLGLIAVGFLAVLKPSSAAQAAGRLMLAGIILFSGSLYLLSLIGERKLGMVTPLGGLALLAGWACMAAAAR